MLISVCNPQKEIGYAFKKSDDKVTSDDKSHILPNNAKTRLHQNTQKLTSALVDYPVRGLKGDVNSDFYEFLTMGIVPYIAGSAMFMFVFNAANKYLNLFEKEKASVYGKKMALGVILYGIMKNVSQNFVAWPVKHVTGVDTEMPYENINYLLPTEAGDKANVNVQYQQRKVFDSKEFYRKDLLDKSYFDKVAVRLGLGDDLKDSVSEVSPIIQNIVATTNTAKRLSSYCWAGVGVGMAVQDCWKDFFNSITYRNKFNTNKNASFIKNMTGKIKNTITNIWKISVSFVKSFFKSFIQMWKGKESSSGFAKHAGKGFICLAKLLTGVLTFNVIVRAKNMAKNTNKETIDKSKETTVI